MRNFFAILLSFFLTLPINILACISGSLSWKCAGEYCETDYECETKQCIEKACMYSNKLTWWAVILIICFIGTVIFILLIVVY